MKSKIILKEISLKSDTSYYIKYDFLCFKTIMFSAITCDCSRRTTRSLQTMHFSRQDIARNHKSSNVRCARNIDVEAKDTEETVQLS